jgi:hypothetical protein
VFYGLTLWRSSTLLNEERGDSRYLLLLQKIDWRELPIDSLFIVADPYIIIKRIKISQEPSGVACCFIITLEKRNLQAQTSRTQKLPFYPTLLLRHRKQNYLTEGDRQEGKTVIQRPNKALLKLHLNRPRVTQYIRTLE